MIKKQRSTIINMNQIKLYFQDTSTPHGRRLDVKRKKVEQKLLEQHKKGIIEIVCVYPVEDGMIYEYKTIN